jgi:hypothetical protein
MRPRQRLHQGRVGPRARRRDARHAAIWRHYHLPPATAANRQRDAYGDAGIRVMTTAAAVMLKAGSELGFSPAARPRLATGAQDPADDHSPWTQLKVIHGGKGAA